MNNYQCRFFIETDAPGNEKAGHLVPAFFVPEKK
jgi:hypothetical protein